ncbi:EpsG family protein [Lactobacillus sp. MRS-253-APC-2B]|uniref:EpsG family protein n=1 Tax=Lactobacillus sp. MRS-253-APC-2B TaxID=2725305 RepID=UPI00146BE6E7|nr:EpsG family protein [Lactobacillus sp. MRS-253-APC-2B]NME33942.1 EpsG family protein [Lactobacillus sp. MRS-253-APC-2B]
MYVYLIAFIVSTILFKCGDFFKEKNRWIVDALGILLLCMVAGFRGISVGTDVSVYLRPSIDAAMYANNFVEYWHASWMPPNGYRLMEISQFEFGYTLLIWIVTKVFHSIVMTQLVVELFIIYPIYFVLRRLKKASVWIGMLTFELMFFNASLNMIRQSMAVSVGLVAVFYWFNNDKIKFLFLTVLAFFFHKSAVILFIVVGLYEFLYSKKRLRNLKLEGSSYRLIIFSVIGTLVVFSSQYLTYLLKFIGLGQYANYMSKASFLPNQILYYLPGLLVLIINWRVYKQYIDNYKFYILMIICAILASQFYTESTVLSANQYGGRIALYFSMFQILAYAQAFKKIRYKYSLLLMLIIYMSFYWWYHYAFLGIDMTVPYTFINY